jgi:hypothetical protein
MTVQVFKNNKAVLYLRPLLSMIAVLVLRQYWLLATTGFAKKTNEFYRSCLKKLSVWQSAAAFGGQKLQEAETNRVIICMDIVSLAWTDLMVVFIFSLASSMREEWTLGILMID